VGGEKIGEGEKSSRHSFPLGLAADKKKVLKKGEALKGGTMEAQAGGGATLCTA